VHLAETKGMTLYQIAAYFKPGKPQPPERNEAYKRFVRRFPCVVCGETRRIETAHFGPHGIAQKSSDYSVLPLCPEHHRTGRHAYHKMKPADFATVHGIDVASLQGYFQDVWEDKLRKRAA
jgi:hypothetical protein